MHEGVSGATLAAIFEPLRLGLLVHFLLKLACVAVPHGINMLLCMDMCVFVCVYESNNMGDVY